MTSHTKYPYQVVRPTEERYRVFFESMDDSVFLMDIAGTILDANPAFKAWIAQYHPDDCIGANIYELMASHHVQNELVAERKSRSEEALHTRKSLSFEDVQDGRILKHSIYPYFSQEGEVSGLFVMTRDITPQKHVERSYRDIQQQLEFLLDTCHLGSWSLDLADGTVRHTLEHDRIFGYDALVPHWDYDLFRKHVLPEDRDMVDRLFREMSATRSGWDTEYRICRKDGEIRWIWEVGGVVRDDQGKALGLQGVSRDITEHKMAEIERSEFVSKMNFALQHSRVAIYEVDLRNHSILRSPDHDSLFGYASLQADWNYRKFLGHVVPEDRDWVEEQFQKRVSLPERNELECRIRRLDGEIRWISLIDIPQFDTNGNIQTILGVIQDVTERKRAIEELSEAYSQWDFTAHTCSIGMWKLDLRTMISHRTPEHARIFGYAPECTEWSTQMFLESIVPADRPEAERLVDDAMAKQIDYGLECRIIRKDGEVRWINVVGAFQFDHEGKACSVLGITRDITEMKQLQNERENIQAKMNFALESLRIGFWENDLQRNLSAHTLEHDRIFGYDTPSSGWCYQTFLEHVIPEDRALLDESMKEVMSRQDAVEREFRIRRADNEIRWVWSICTPKFDESGQLESLSGIIQDVTETKEAELERTKLQEQLQQSQKMELVGQLAGGIAHDFNNVIAAILGSVEMIIRKIDDQHPFYENLECIRHSANRSADMVRQLLAFARKQVWSPRIIDLDEEMLKICSLLDKLIREQIQLKLDMNSRHALVRLDPSHLLQVITNLCVNSRDSIQGDGFITIETDLLTGSECERWSGSATGIADKWVRISVSDTGRGIDSQVLPHVFEPFFTTKEVGQGTGLGLSMVYGIVKQNGGFIECYSEIGHGTTFQIHFPVYRHLAAPTSNATPDQPEGTCHDVVMLVEDEPDILKIITTLLEGQGLTVLASDSAEEALLIFEKQQGKVSLVISDVVLPGMNGIQMSRRLMHLNPNLKFVFMSGYNTAGLDHEGAFRAGDNFIAKPFAIKDFMEMVHSAIASGKE
jgi:PAS domain S-box-containing protein